MNKIDNIIKLLAIGNSSLILAGLSTISNEKVKEVILDKNGHKGVVFRSIRDNEIEIKLRDKINTELFIDRIENNLYIPSKERAIVENIKYDLKYVDEGNFLESLERYTRSPFYSYELLVSVGEHLNVSKDEIDYWINESEDYNSY